MNQRIISRKRSMVFALALAFAMLLCTLAFSANANAATVEPAAPQFKAAAAPLSNDIANALNADVPASLMGNHDDDNFSAPTYHYCKRGVSRYYATGPFTTKDGTVAYGVEIKNGYIKGSITCKNGYDLYIYSTGTVTIKGGIKCEGNIYIYGSGTLKVTGGIHSDASIGVSRKYTSSGNLSSTAFYLKSYNSTKKITNNGIECDNMLWIQGKAKVYANGYSSKSPYGIGVVASTVQLSSSGYLSAKGKKRGVECGTLLVGYASLYAKETLSTAKSSWNASTRNCAIACNLLSVNTGKVSATASGKYSTAISADSGISAYNGASVKAYAKNYGFGVMTAGGNISFDGASLTSYGASAAVHANHDGKITFANGAKLYAYGKNSKGTRVGHGVLSRGYISIDNSYAKVYAKSGTAYYGIFGDGINISNGSTCYVYAKKYNALYTENGVYTDNSSTVKVNDKRVYGSAGTF